MARKIKTAKTLAAAVEMLIDPAMETATHALVVDHHSQTGSWERPEEDTTDPTLPMGEDGNVLVDPIDSELEQAVQALEALEEVHADEAAEEAPEVHTVQAPQTWSEMIAAFDEDLVNETVFATAAAIDTRAAHEFTKDPDNTNIQRTLKKVRSQLVTKRAARVMLATSVDPDWLLNREVHSGSRYNVYALGKFADIVFAVTDGALSNAINNAIIRSLFRCQKAGVTFTEHAAKAACSKQMHIEHGVAQHLVRHTVSPSTAPTQSNSTLQALQTLGVVQRNGGRGSFTYALTDSLLTTKLEEVLKAA